MPRTASILSTFEPWETTCISEGYRAIAGVDEVGRGCIAGPVVAAAVILPPSCHLPGVNDSKALSAKARDALFPQILNACLCFGVGIVSTAIIDEINILQASLLAMHRAILQLRVRPDVVLVDGRDMIPQMRDIPQKPLIDGDARCLSIAAASIVAKVTRDRLMSYIGRDYPEYGFAQHKGYGTRDHRSALHQYGVTLIHRKSFAPVRDLLQISSAERLG